MSRLTDLKLTTIVKLGAILVRAEELLECGADTLADEALHSLLTDPEIASWRKIMDNAGLLPKKGLYIGGEVK